MPANRRSARLACRSEPELAWLRLPRAASLVHGWALKRRWRRWDQGDAPFRQGTPRLPFKANADRRHHIPRQQQRVRNRPAYEAGLRARGSLTVWFTAEAIKAWQAEPRTTRGGQPRYSALAITTALTLRAVFRLALRQTEGLIASIISLLGLDLAVVASALTDKEIGRAHV